MISIPAGMYVSSVHNTKNFIGTPGTGKSTLSSAVSEQAGLEWINIGELAQANDLYEEYDESFQCHVLDEDGVIC